MDIIVKDEFPLRENRFAPVTNVPSYMVKSMMSHSDDGVNLHSDWVDSHRCVAKLFTKRSSFQNNFPPIAKLYSQYREKLALFSWEILPYCIQTRIFTLAISKNGVMSEWTLLWNLLTDLYYLHTRRNRIERISWNFTFSFSKYCQRKISFLRFCDVVVNHVFVVPQYLAPVWA